MPAGRAACGERGTEAIKRKYYIRAKGDQAPLAKQETQFIGSGPINTEARPAFGQATFQFKQIRANTGNTKQSPIHRAYVDIGLSGCAPQGVAKERATWYMSDSTKDCATLGSIDSLAYFRYFRSNPPVTSVPRTRSNRSRLTGTSSTGS